MEITEKAPAKINLGIDVIGKREDGYHELKMVMASVDLKDQLLFQAIPEDRVEIETNKSFLPVDQRNHIYQAAQVVKKKFGITSGVSVKVQKKIPVAAGLAGGSSNAAATLRALNKLWNLGLTLEEMIPLAEEVGTDVPYCLYGNTAYVTGKGEIVEPLPTLPQCWIVLVKPKISVSTGKIFKAVDLENLVHPDIGRLKSAVETGDYDQMIAHLGNSLEPVTTHKFPVVEHVKAKMLKFGVDAAVMSGSGPTVLGFCQKYSRAQRVCNAMKGFCDEVYIVRTLNR